MIPAPELKAQGSRISLETRSNKMGGIMFIRILLIFLGLRANLYGASRMVDGKVQFAVAEVNGVPAWTEAEKDAMVANITAMSTVTLNVADYEPTAFEVSIATSGIRFSSHSDY